MVCGEERKNGQLCFSSLCEFAPCKNKTTYPPFCFIGTETETKAFMAICVETLKRFVSFNSSL